MSASFNRSSGRSTPAYAGVKRKRTTLLETHETEERHQADYAVTASAKGDIEIADVCADGRFLRLRNKGAAELPIGGWRLSAVGAGGAETLFKFHRSVKVDAGATVTVWSMDAGAAHEPPTSVVMKQQRWQAGDEVTVKLVTDAGDEVASLERQRQRLTHRASRLSRPASAAGGSGGSAEELYHQLGDPQQEQQQQQQPAGQQEKCSIM